MYVYIEVLRPQQWYKNLLVFVGIVFAGRMTDITLYPTVMLGFFILSIVSGAGYIINDIVDIKKDKLHPKKKNRPLPSGRISPGTSAVYAAGLLIFSLATSFKINPLFGVTVFLLFLTSQLYTLWLKNIVFADVITIAINFVWRAISGVFIISSSWGSSWFILCTFLLALFIALCKRRGDLIALGGSAPKHKSVLNHYNIEILNVAITLMASSLIVSYAMYSFLAHTSRTMMLTIPIATFLVFRYLFLVYTGQEVSMNPEKIFLDRQFITGLIIWLVVALAVLYIYIY